MNSGVSPSQTACKRNSLYYLYSALNHEHQLFLVFEIKLQVYWGASREHRQFFPPLEYTGTVAQLGNLLL